MIAIMKQSNIRSFFHRIRRRENDDHQINRGDAGTNADTNAGAPTDADQHHQDRDNDKIFQIKKKKASASRSLSPSSAQPAPSLRKKRKVASECQQIMRSKKHKNQQQQNDGTPTTTTTNSSNHPILTGSDSDSNDDSKKVSESCESSSSNSSKKLEKEMGTKVSPVLCREIKTQIEYYLSDENLQSDTFYRPKISNGSDGWFELSHIMTAPRIRSKSVICEEVVYALRTSTSVETKYDIENNIYWIRRTGGKKLPPYKNRQYNSNNSKNGYYNNKRRRSSRDYDSDYGFSGGCMGYSGRECDTLLEYGVKPWDDDAGIMMGFLDSNF